MLSEECEHKYGWDFECKTRNNIELKCIKCGEPTTVYVGVDWGKDEELQNKSK